MSKAGKNMISVAEAKLIIANFVIPLSATAKSLAEAVDHVLAEDIFSTINLPPFNQSSVDGYAFAFDDAGKDLTVSCEVPAGSKEKIILRKGEAARIFTGAPVPQGADTILMQEQATIRGKILHVPVDKIKKGDHLRLTGAEIAAGQLAIEKYSVLTPAAIGYIAGLGRPEILVYPMPVVGIILTGQELRKPGDAIDHGQVYDSNSFMLTAALNTAGVTAIHTYYADDNLEATTNVLSQSLELCDLILLVGGISVGDYDFVLEATRQNDVEQFFHKVKQRPGKPVFFGMKDNKPVFGLPGNPSSVLTCYYQYVYPALGSLTNRQLRLPEEAGTLKYAYAKKTGLTHFLKGTYEGGCAIPLGAQESYRLSSYKEANCLISLDEERGDYYAGETVKVCLLPN